MPDLLPDLPLLLLARRKEGKPLVTQSQTLFSDPVFPALTAQTVELSPAAQFWALILYFIHYSGPVPPDVFDVEIFQFGHSIATGPLTQFDLDNGHAMWAEVRPQFPLTMVITNNDVAAHPFNANVHYLVVDKERDMNDVHAVTTFLTGGALLGPA